MHVSVQTHRHTLHAENNSTEKDFKRIPLEFNSKHTLSNEFSIHYNFPHL